jgi:imidazolonepropionase-like amidohydrolase
MTDDSQPRTYTSRWILDGDGNEPIANGTVTVRGDEIIDVGRSQGRQRTKNDIDLGEATLLPGLVDAHVHLVWNAGSTPHEEVLLDENPTRTVLRMAGRARQILRRGTTTVRDLGATDSLSIPIAQAVEAGDIPGPTIFAAGRAIAMTGGHAWHITAEADGPSAIRRAVREEIKRGATAIKFMASGGVYDKTAQIHQPQLTFEELRAGVEEAHKSGLIAAAHAYTPGPINLALDAGADTIEHGSFLDEETARRMKESGKFFVPTMMASDLIVRQADAVGTPEYMRCKGEAVREAVRAAVKMALDIGTPIAGGSDSGGAGIGHGRLPYEAELLTQCGATPIEAARICTSQSAAAIGASDRGSLSVGKKADLLAVQGNVATNIRALSNVILVVKNGTQV